MLNSIKVLAMASAASMALSATANAAAFKLGHVFDGSHPFHVAAEQAAAHFAQCSNNEHSIDIYAASQLGSDVEMQQQILIGGLDITLSGNNFTANSYPPFAIASAPFIFADRDHALRYQDSELYRDLWRGWEDVTGQHVLSSALFGFFNVTSNTPISKPEDMAGLKIRVPNMATFLAFPEAVGASPTPVPLHEVYMALQQGVVDASANGLSMTYANRFYEVQEYVNLTAHMAEFTLWVTSDIMWSRLDDAGKACLQEAADIWGSSGTQLLHEFEVNIRKDLEASNEIVFNEVDIEAFQKATQQSLITFADSLGMSLEDLDVIRDL